MYTVLLRCIVYAVAIYTVYIYIYTLNCHNQAFIMMPRCKSPEHVRYSVGFLFVCLLAHIDFRGIAIASPLAVMSSAHRQTKGSYQS